MSAERPRAQAPLAGALCVLASWVLPRDARQRYAAEWRADLSADPAHALRYAVSVLGHAPVLRLTLAGVVKPEQPLSCQLGRHRYVTIHDNPENRRATSHLCTRCGHIKDDWRGPEKVVNGFAWAGSSGMR